MFHFKLYGQSYEKTFVCEKCSWILTNVMQIIHIYLKI